MYPLPLKLSCDPACTITLSRDPCAITITHFDLWNQIFSCGFLFPLFFFVGAGTEYSRVMLHINSLYNMGRGQGKGGVPSFIELAENDPDT